MPKRIPTPPPGDDEPRYLTVVHPYAISGTCNMELPKDRQDFARWVACCIDKDAFFAVFHKPSSRGMVILEIKRDYPHFDRILGEHRWSEFLQKPTKEEKDRVSQVFYCTYNTGRLVQKHGWKRIDVDEAWFKAWSPNNRHIRFPYPPAHFCDVPVEDLTREPLCRPLPGAVKPQPPVEPIAAPRPVVGSAAWIQTKAGTMSPPVAAQAKPNPPRAWGQGGPKSLVTAKPNPTANGSAKVTVGVPQARQPAVGGGPVVVKTGNVWQNNTKKAPPTDPPANWDDSAPASRQSTPLSRAISPSTAPALAGPPGLPARKNAWGSGATSYPTQPPGLPVPAKATSVVQGDPGHAGSAASWGSVGASGSASSPDSDSGPDLATATESDNPYSVHIHFSESMEEEFHGMGIRAMEDDEDPLGLDSIAPGTWNVQTDDAALHVAAAAGWDDDALDAEDHWNQVQETTVKPDLCNAHGIICKKGICAEYARQVRQAKRAKEAEERRAAAANKGKKGARGKGAWKKNNEDQKENAGMGRNMNQNNPFRGPGAPVKTNWRGKPREIVSADTIEKRETTKSASDDDWGNSDLEIEPNVAAVVPAADAADADAASTLSWGVSEDAFNPWGNTAQPVPKAKGPVAKPQGNKNQKPGQTKTSSNWAEQVDAELAATGKDDDAFTTVSKRSRGSKRGTSTASWGTSAAKSSTSGWGSVSDMPW